MRKAISDLLAFFTIFVLLGYSTWVCSLVYALVPWWTLPVIFGLAFISAAHAWVHMLVLLQPKEQKENPE